MDIDIKTIEKVARLARLKLNSSEITSMQNSLNGILTWIDQLSEVDTDNVLPLANVTLDQMPIRDDMVNHTLSAQDVTAHTHHVIAEMFVVPKVVE